MLTLVLLLLRVFLERIQSKKKIWLRIMGPGTIYILPSGETFLKEYWGYVCSGFFGTTFYNSNVYTALARTIGAYDSSINGDDALVMAKTPLDWTSVGVEISTDDKYWCSMELVALSKEMLEHRKFYAEEPTGQAKTDLS